MFKTIHRFSGLTLIELLLGLTLSIIIISTLTPLYSTVKRNHFIVVSLAALQNNIAMAQQLIAADIRLAGYAGCARSELVNPAISPKAHEVLLWHASLENASLVQPMFNSKELIVSGMSIAKGDQLIISDCQTAERLAVQQVMALWNGKQKIIATQPLRKWYQPFAEITQWQSRRYFIATTHRKNQFNQFIRALFVADEKQRTYELVEGIDEMQLHFTVLANGKLIEKTAEECQPSEKIVAVSIQWSASIFDQTKTSYTYVALHQNPF